MVEDLRQVADLERTIRQVLSGGASVAAEVDQNGPVAGLGKHSADRQHRLLATLDAVQDQDGGARRPFGLDDPDREIRVRRSDRNSQRLRNVESGEFVGIRFGQVG